jgi:hypothetical protein
METSSESGPSSVLSSAEQSQPLLVPHEVLFARPQHGHYNRSTYSSSYEVTTRQLSHFSNGPILLGPDDTSLAQLGHLIAAFHDTPRMRPALLDFFQLAATRHAEEIPIDGESGLSHLSQHSFSSINCAATSLLPDVRVFWYTTNASVQQVSENNNTTEGRRCDWVLSVNGHITQELELKTPVSLSDASFVKLYDMFCTEGWQLLRDPANREWVVREFPLSPIARRGDYRHLVIQVSFCLVMSLSQPVPSFPPVVSRHHCFHR